MLEDFIDLLLEHITYWHHPKWYSGESVTAKLTGNDMECTCVAAIKFFGLLNYIGMYEYCKDISMWFSEYSYSSSHNMDFINLFDCACHYCSLKSYECRWVTECKSIWDKKFTCDFCCVKRNQHVDQLHKQCLKEYLDEI